MHGEQIEACHHPSLIEMAFPTSADGQLLVPEHDLYFSKADCSKMSHTCKSFLRITVSQTDAASGIKLVDLFHYWHMNEVFATSELLHPH